MLYSIVFILIGSTSLSLLSVLIILEHLFDIFSDCFSQFSWVSKVNPRKLKSSTFLIIMLFILRTGVLNFFLACGKPFVVSLLFILKDSRKHFLLFFLKNNFIYSFPCVSDVRFIFSEGGRKIMLFGCAYASLYYSNYVFKFIHIISYSRVLGFVSFILLYNLSRNFMDFSRPIVIHLGILCLYLSNFINLLNV